jgi:YegS/Rv2252/BmrU family lipid kinase
MSKILIILNPHAGGGRAGRVWQELEPLLWQQLGELVIVVTQKPDEVALHLGKAHTNGIQRVIAIGGDGTNHALINGVIALNEQHPDTPPMIYGNIPVGTGRDWARGLNIPTGDVKAMASWIAQAQPRPTDIGMLTYNGDSKREYFLNIASAGIGGDVSERVNRVTERKSWTFLRATLETLLTYSPQPIRVWLDGQEWYEGGAYIAAVANGSTFGHGMKIAPNAEIRDGLFEVILVKAISKLAIFTALKRVYDATHLTHPAVMSAQAREVKIERIGAPDPINLELDGEYNQGRDLRFTMRPGLLQILS